MSLVDSTVQVRRANVYLRVPQDEVSRYIAKGYDVVDDKGNVLKASVPNDLGTLQKAFLDKNAEIKSLKAEIGALKEELSELKKQAQPAKKTSNKKSE